MAEGPVAPVWPGVMMAAVLGFGAVANLLVLTGPLFMLQVYDRVLPSQSATTLFALLGLVAGLHLAMAGLDSARSMLLVRLGARLRRRHERAMFLAGLARGRGSAWLRDLDLVERFAGSAVALAVIDLPWLPVFAGILWLVHPLLGAVALGGALALIAMAALSAVLLAPAQARAQATLATIDRHHGALRDAGPDFVALLSGAGVDHWQALRDRSLDDTLFLADRLARLTARTRAFRLFLQSAMLAAGAWLVLQGALSAGLMVAASILMGRAIAPVETLAGQLPMAASALAAARRIARQSGDPAPAALSPEAGALLTLRDVVVLGDSGRPILHLTGFDLAPGRALAVIGPSGSGKSTLARLLCGGVSAAAGTLRLGSVPLSRLAQDDIGYLPQHPVFLPLTIGATIARQERAPPGDAATLAGVEALIRAQPAGYDTPVDPAVLPAGLLSRVALARALHGRPRIVVLDNPSAFADPDGAVRLKSVLRTLKAAGTVVIVTADRPDGIEDCEDILVLEQGRQMSFGPRERIVRTLARRDPPPDRSDERRVVPGALS